MRPPNDPSYRKWYERGWRYSGQASGSQTLDYGDSIGAPDAWYDGYLDRAAPREKWHCHYCRLAGGCDDHQWTVA